MVLEIYKKSHRWARDRYHKSGYKGPEWPGYTSRHPYLQRIMGRPKKVSIPVPPEWFAVICKLEGHEFLSSLTAEEWAEGKFKEQRFLKWRKSLPERARRQQPSSPRIGAIIRFFRKQAARKGISESCLHTLQRALENRGRHEAWVAALDDPLSILEMGRLKK